MRIAIISDIHEDIRSLRKIIRKIEGTGYDRLVCLGDISGFSVPYYKYQASRSAHDCLSLLREKNAIIVPGNHDYHAARKVPKHAPAFEFPGDWYALEYGQRKLLAKDMVWLHEENDLNPLYTLEDIQYLRGLPEYHVMKDAGGKDLLFSHYVWPNLSGFVKGFYTSPLEYEKHFGFMTSLNCNISFTGHAHVRGYSLAFGRYVAHHRFGSRRLATFPACVGIPPVTRHKKRSGFCIFDTASIHLRVARC